MQYWNDMNDKYGFNEGGSVPPDAGERREVYLRALSVLADKHGSNVRYVAYDRPGVHNGCMVILVTKEQFDTLSDNERYVNGPDHIETIPNEDVGVKQAVIEAMNDMNLDEFVKVSVVINRKGLTKAINTIR